VGIAYVTRELGLGPVVGGSAHPPATTDPDLRGKTTSYEDFVATRTAGVLEDVDQARVLAQLAREWKDPIRLLWIDGDHTYEGEGGYRHVQAVSRRWSHCCHARRPGHVRGVLRVFVEEILDLTISGQRASADPLVGRNTATAMVGGFALAVGCWRFLLGD
jgi:hypothetical protein